MCVCMCVHQTKRNQKAGVAISVVDTVGFKANVMLITKPDGSEE